MSRRNQRGRRKGIWSGMTVLCHHRAVHMSNASTLITAAGAMTGLSAAVIVRSRRHGNRVPAARLAVAVPGAYLGLFTTVEDLPWLFLPTRLLLLAAAAVQVWPAVRSGRQDPRGGPHG